MKKFILLLFCLMAVYTCCIMWIFSDDNLTSDIKAGICVVAIIPTVIALMVADLNDWFKHK